jgi:hypothetical protein
MKRFENKAQLVRYLDETTDLTVDELWNRCDVPETSPRNVQPTDDVIPTEAYNTMSDPNVHRGGCVVTFRHQYFPDERRESECIFEIWHRGHEEVVGTGEVCVIGWDHPDDTLIDIDLKLHYEDARQMGLRLIEAASVAEEYDGVDVDGM